MQLPPAFTPRQNEMKTVPNGNREPQSASAADAVAAATVAADEAEPN